MRLNSPSRLLLSAAAPGGRKGVTLQFAPVPPEAAGDDDVQTHWVQVAYEGQFLGYRDGEQPFAFTRQHFEQAVRNLHSNPAFAAGPDGVGTAPVIPWDFNHASELHPADGSLPAMGAPAQGWTYDLQIRDATDGTAQLWALTSYMEPARTYVRNGQYAWASVSAIFDATHPATAENIGMIITSIALTNTPFLEGMERLVASKTGAVQARGFFFEPADSAEDALKLFREMLGLTETTDAAGVMAEIAKLAEWAASGTAPLGVDVADLISGARRILGLPALTTEQEVLDNASQIIQRLIAEQATGQQPAAPAPAEGATLEDEMLLKKLASLLGVRESDDAVEDAVQGLVKLHATLADKLSLAATSGPSVLLEAAEESVNARDKLTGLLKALGVDDPDEAVDQVATLIQQAEELKSAMPELEGLRARQKQAEEKEAEAEVAEAMASYNVPDAAREALLLMRTSTPEKFAEKFPKKEAPKQTPPTHLSRPMVAAPGGSQITPTDSAQLGGNEVNLDAFDGRNPTEKAKSYLASTHAGWDNLTPEQQFKMAVALKRQPNVKFTPIQAVAS